MMLLYSVPANIPSQHLPLLNLPLARKETIPFKYTNVGTVIFSILAIQRPITET
jgi:hypothetical protein